MTAPLLERVLEAGRALAGVAGDRPLAPLLADHAERIAGSPNVRVCVRGERAVVRGDPGRAPLRLPMGVRGVTFGSIEAAPARAGSFSREARAALATLALQGALAAETANLLEAERQGGAVRVELGAARRGLRERGRQLGGVLELQERERAEIAHELHDEAAQVLAAVGFGLGALERDLETSSGSRIRQLRSHVHGVMGELRDLAVTLRPPVLDAIGLEPALRRLGSEERFAGVTLELEGDAMSLDPDVQTSVYRVVEEALGAVEMAKGARVALRPDEVTVDVSAGGPGRPGRLATLAGRLELLGGRLVTVPGVGPGTRLIATLRHPAVGLADRQLGHHRGALAG